MSKLTLRRDTPRPKLPCGLAGVEPLSEQDLAQHTRAQLLADVYGELEQAKEKVLKGLAHSPFSVREYNIQVMAPVSIFDGCLHSKLTVVAITDDTVTLTEDGDATWEVPWGALALNSQIEIIKELYHV